jgi:asparagine synthase (glutamine-hydrolysing)
VSAIAGLWHLDGEPVGCDDLQRMLRPLSHRGPDGSGAWCRGPAAVGHQLLRTTPEPPGARLPLVRRDGDLVLTSDARIDNREELVGVLGLRVAPDDATDSELILGAYERWGARCTEHLVGDFAFAVWDRERGHLFCARDHFGVKPFYYHHRPGRIFAFASEIKGLLGLREVPRRLNETRVADYLQWSFDDQEITFFEEILRLPPAHTLLVRLEGISLGRYWSLDPDREVRRGCDEEYAEELREIFFEAVRCRLRSVPPVGSSLSGGLDSSSIVCTARELLRQQGRASLHTFSLVFDDLPQCDERPYIEAVLAGGDLVPHLIRGDRLSPLEDLDTYLRFEDEASWVFNMCLHWAMHRAAAEQNVRVFLDGLGGDEVVGHGLARLAELARRGHLLELAASAVRLGRHFERSPLRILKRQALRPLLPPALLRTWSRMRGGTPAAEPPIRPLVAKALAEGTSLAERLRQRREAGSGAAATTRGAHHLGLVAGISSAGFESIDRVAAAFRIEPRYPFFDKRLVEHCLALPGEQKLRWGWTRVGFRRAMAGVLPEAVRWRGGKTDLSPQFHQGFLTYERERIERVVNGTAPAIAPYVDVALLRDLYREYASGAAPRNAEQIWHPVMLALWLKRAPFRASRATPPPLWPAQERRSVR